MNGKDSTADRATRLLLPNMAENTTTEGGLGLDLDHGVHTTGTELWKTSYRTFSTGLCHWHTYCPTCRQHGNLKRWTDYPLAPKSIPEHHVFWYSVSTKYTILTVTP